MSGMVSGMIPTSSGLVKLLLEPSFRWLCYMVVIILTVLGYMQEPVRFSNYESFLGLPYRFHYYIMICGTLGIYVVTFLGLWYTIRWDANTLSTYWYIPVIVLIYAIVTHFFLTSFEVSTDTRSNNLHPPPWYMMPNSTRVWIYYGIFVLDMLIFISALLYAGTSQTYESTILHKFFLNKFGGLSPGNTLNFMVGWLGVAGLLIDIYIIHIHNTYSACQYGLPASWDF